MIVLLYNYDVPTIDHRTATVTHAALPLEPRLKLVCTVPTHTHAAGLLWLLPICIYTVAAHDISLASFSFKALDVSLITTCKRTFSPPMSTGVHYAMRVCRV